MSRSMTMPESLSAPSDKIIYQVGLNTLRYQEIERIAKRLIEFSDYTVTSSDISKDRPTPISWSFNPSVNTTKNTMGSLVSLLCDLQDVDENKESDDKDEFKISFKMSHGVIDRQRIQNLFQKIITDRNNFTHHFENYYVDPNSNFKQPHEVVLKRLQFEYNDAGCFLEKLKSELKMKIDFIIEHMNLFSEVVTINQVANIFDEAYQSCKRSDGWAVWQQVMHYVYKTPNTQTNIEKLKKKKSLKTTKNMLMCVFPNWLFKDEPTKNGSRILVKVDNTSVNIDSSFPEIIISY